MGVRRNIGRHLRSLIVILRRALNGSFVDVGYNKPVAEPTDNPEYIFFAEDSTRNVSTVDNA